MTETSGVDWFKVAAIVGAGSGVIGTVLSVINMVRDWRRQRVRLRVIPLLRRSLGNAIFSDRENIMDDAWPAVEVSNLCEFPVTISEVGFTKSGDDGRLAILPEPGELPKRLEARSSTTVTATRQVGFPCGAEKAYARTECGHTWYGDSPVLKKWKRSSKPVQH